MVLYGSIEMEPLQSPEVTHSPSVDLFLSQSVMILNPVRLSLAHLRSSARHWYRVCFVMPYLSMRRSGASCWSIFHCRLPIVLVIILLDSVTFIHFHIINLPWLFLINRFDIFIMDVRISCWLGLLCTCTYWSGGRSSNLADLVYVTVLVSYSEPLCMVSIT